MINFLLKNQFLTQLLALLYVSTTHFKQVVWGKKEKRKITYILTRAQNHHSIMWCHDHKIIIRTTPHPFQFITRNLSGLVSYLVPKIVLYPKSEATKKRTNQLNCYDSSWPYRWEIVQRNFLDIPLHGKHHKILVSFKFTDRNYWSYPLTIR